MAPLTLGSIVFRVSSSSTSLSKVTGVGRDVRVYGLAGPMKVLGRVVGTTVGMQQ